MKIHLKFNHNTKHCLEAMDCPMDSEEANDLLNEVIIKYMSNPNLDKKSQLAELLHDELDYSIILYLATNLVTKEIEHKMMKKLLKEFMNDEDDELI